MVNMSISTNFMNDTGVTASIVKGLFDNVGGSWFSTMMVIVLFVILIAVILRIPIELTAIFILPLILVMYAYIPDFLSVTAVALIYVGILVGKNWFFNR